MKKTKLVLAALALAASTAALSAGDVAAIFEKQCQKCHGADGTGQTPMGKKLSLKDFTDAKVQAAFTDAEATKAIKEGVKDGDKTKMKAAEDVTDDDIKALVAKVRAFKK
jgi:mono/diheme cytochrome c family protein